MTNDVQQRLLFTIIRSRNSLEESRELVCKLDPLTLGSDGEAVKAKILQQLERQVEQLVGLEAKLSRSNQQ